MQQIWKDKIQWDEKLTPYSSSIWKSFTKTFNEISKIKVPRWLGTVSKGRIEIHGFCDSSVKTKQIVLTYYVRKQR